MKGKIKIGACIFHDMHSGYWPASANEEPADPETIFDMKWSGIYWDCIADGFGSKKNYMNGSIYAEGIDSVIPVGNSEEIEKARNQLIEKQTKAVQQAESKYYQELEKLTSLTSGSKVPSGD